MAFLLCTIGTSRKFMEILGNQLETPMLSMLCCVPNVMWKSNSSTPVPFKGVGVV